MRRELVVEKVNEEEKSVSVRLNLRKCNTCQSWMLPHSLVGLYKLNDHGFVQLGISRQSYEYDLVCDDCLSKRKYQRQCDLCKKQKGFPYEFAFMATIRGEDFTDYRYICRECVEKNPRAVVEELAVSSETTDFRWGRE